MKKSLIGIFAALLASSPALSADLYQPEPVPMQPIEEPVQVASTSGWYLRGDAGYSFNRLRGAKFYQGSSQYASKDYKGAIQNLQAMIQANPTDARAPDALLIVAASQIELNNMAGAKASLQKIVKDYPSTSAAETAKSRLKLLQ